MTTDMSDAAAPNKVSLKHLHSALALQVTLGRVSFFIRLERTCLGNGGEVVPGGNRQSHARRCLAQPTSRPYLWTRPPGACEAGPDRLTCRLAYSSRRACIAKLILETLAQYRHCRAGRNRSVLFPSCCSSGRCCTTQT